MVIFDEKVRQDQEIQDKLEEEKINIDQIKEDKKLTEQEEEQKPGEMEDIKELDKSQEKGNVDNETPSTIDDKTETKENNEVSDQPEDGKKE